MKSCRNIKFAYFTLPILMLFVFCCSHSTVSVDYYPTEVWRMSTPEEQGMHSENLLKMMESIQESQIAIQSVSIIEMVILFWTHISIRMKMVRNIKCIL